MTHCWLRLKRHSWGMWFMHSVDWVPHWRQPYHRTCFDCGQIDVKLTHKHPVGGWQEDHPHRRPWPEEYNKFVDGEDP